jgi:hypothetical protein
MVWRLDGAGLGGEAGELEWNKVEHRVFSCITVNWRGRPLVSYRTVIEMNSSTTTKSGLRVRADRDWNWYETGVKVSDLNSPPSRPRLTAGTVELETVAAA